MNDHGKFSNKTASGTVVSGVAKFVSVILTGGSDAATAIIYDNTAASGTVIAKLAAAAGKTEIWNPGVKLPVGTGIHVALTGTSPSCTVVYTAA